MSSASDRIRKLAVLALVVAIAFQPAVGGAMAASADSAGAGPVLNVAPDCDPKDSGELALDLVLGRLDEGAQIAQNAFDGGSLLTSNRDNGCYSEEEVSNITHGTIYEGGLITHDLQEAVNATYKNHLDASETVSQTIVDAEVDYALQNNLTLSEAKDRINNSLADYYTTRQKNLIEAHNSTILNLIYLKGRAENAGTHESIAFDIGDGSTFYDADYGATNGTPRYLKQPNVTSNYTVTLLNNNTTTVYVVEEWFDDSGVTNYLDPFGATPADNTPIEVYVTNPQEWPGGTDFSNDMSEANSELAYYEGTWADRWNSIKTQHDRVIDNAMVMVEGVYSEYNASTWDVNTSTDVLGCDMLAQEYSTERNSTGYYSWAGSQLGCMGISGDVNNSFTITYTPDNDTDGYEPNVTAGESINVSGTLYTDWEPAKTNGSYVVGEVYNTTDAGDEPVYFAAQFNDSARIIELDGEFEIAALTNAQTGESLNETTLPTEFEATWNASLTPQRVELLLEYDREQREAGSTGGGGGGGGFNFGFDAGMAGIGALVALGAGLYLVSSGASKAS